MGYIYRTISAMIIAYQFRSSTGTVVTVDDSHLCQDPQIDLSGLDSNKVISGSIYSPNFPLPYGDSNQNCSIHIIGLRSDRLITLHHKKEEQLGPCIKDLKIDTNQTSDQCSDQQAMFHQQDSIDGISIFLDRSVKLQPAFTISFTFHPLFYLENEKGNSKIHVDVMSAQEGYIAGKPGIGRHPAQIRLENFPVTATVLFEIRPLDDLPDQPLRIRMETQLSRFHNQIYSANDHNVLSYAPQRGEQFILVKTYQTRSIMQHIIKYSVTHCDSNLDNLYMIQEALIGSEFNTSYFTATCNDGYKTKGEHSGYFTCDAWRWKPNLQCVPNSIIRNAQGIELNGGVEESTEKASSSIGSNEQGKEMTHGDHADEPTTEIAMIFGAALGVTITIALVSLGIRKKCSHLGRLHRRDVQNRILQNSARNLRPLPDEPEIQSSSTYDVIDEVDPYSGYWDINEENMIPNNITSGNKQGRQPVTNPTYGTQSDTICHSGNPTTHSQSSNMVADSSNGPSSHKEIARMDQVMSEYHSMWNAMEQPEDMIAQINYRGGKESSENENSYCDNSLQYEPSYEPISVPIITVAEIHRDSDSISHTIIEGSSSSHNKDNNPTLISDPDLSRLFDEYTIPDKVDDNHVYSKIRPTPKTL